jgi:hypothetical protein
MDDPEKCAAVFRKAQTTMQSAMTILPDLIELECRAEHNTCHTYK